MKMTPDRKTKITEIINSGKIRTQEELLAILRKNGYEVTQATLSRDMRSLGAVKIHDVQSGFHYRIPTDGKSNQTKPFIKVEASGQCCVVRTQPGYASAIASVIDKSSIPGVMGTIAGDDTILIIIRLDEDSRRIAESVESLL